MIAGTWGWIYSLYVRMGNNMLKLIILAIGALMVAGCKPQEVNSAGVPIGEGGSATSESTAAGTSESTATETPKTEAIPYQIPYPDRQPKDGDEVAVFETDKGRIVFTFFADKAPKHVTQMKKLISSGFYNGTRFHRCIPGFMIQGGDPNSKEIAKAGAWGTGGYTENGKEVNVKAEFTEIKHLRGVLSAARSASPDSASSQFFIMVKDTASLDGQYSAWGQVVSGMDVADQIVTTGDAANNGAVDANAAIVLKSAKLAKWPIQ